MKINESTLQNILNSQGKDARADKINPKNQKPEKAAIKFLDENLGEEELNIIRYDKEGKVSIDSESKNALIDFFQ